MKPTTFSYAVRYVLVIQIPRTDPWGKEITEYEADGYISHDTFTSETDLESLLDHDLIQWLIDHSWLTGLNEHYYVEDLAHGDGFCLNICKLTGEPVLELTKE